jgi:hypothetical protein
MGFVCGVGPYVPVVMITTNISRQSANHSNFIELFALQPFKHDFSETA